MDRNFDKELPIILREEGGNDDDPDDPGGRTSRGIIQREWDKFRQSHPGRPSDVWRASDEDIATIYRQNYWQPHAITMPSGVDLMFFNTAVNSGTRRAAIELQRALGVDDDGIIGPKTRKALEDAKDHPYLIREMAAQRRRFYRGLSLCWKYCRGWLARTDRVEHDALQFANKKVAARMRTKKELGKGDEVGRAKAFPEEGKAKAIPEED